MAANDAEFDKGGPAFAHHLEKAGEGMWAPHEVVIPANTYLIRFADSVRACSGGTLGAWWLTVPAARVIGRTSSGNDLTLGFNARRALAVKQGWSRLDVCVKARTTDELRALTGRGKPQHREPTPNGMSITWQPWKEIHQLYIPGVSQGGGLTDVGRRSLLVLSERVIPSMQMW